MKTLSQPSLYFHQFRERTFRLVRSNLPVLVMTGLSLLILKCEGANTDVKTILVPLLVSSEANASTAIGNNPGNGGGTGGTEIPITVNDPPPSVAPILNDINYITNNANPADDPYSTKGLLQFQKTSISFVKPVPANTEVSLYLGKKNMELLADGTVTNAVTIVNRTAANFSGYTFLVDSDRKYKVFVVAKNEFGISSKELKIGHARNCANAIKTPGTFGNCTDHCFETNQVADRIEIKVKYNLPVDGVSLSLDIAGLNPRTTLPEYIAPAVNLDIATPKAGEHTITTSFGIHEKEYLCTNVQSLLMVDQPFRFTLLKGYVSIPNE